MAGSSDEFSEFVARSYRPLVRTAYLLVGDSGHAEDLVQSALMRTMRSWHRLHAHEAATAYTRVTIVRLAGRWRERRWRGEIPSAALPDLSDETSQARRSHWTCAPRLPGCRGHNGQYSCCGTSRI